MCTRVNYIGMANDGLRQNFGKSKSSNSIFQSGHCFLSMSIIATLYGNQQPLFYCDETASNYLGVMAISHKRSFNAVWCSVTVYQRWGSLGHVCWRLLLENCVIARFYEFLPRLSLTSLRYQMHLLNCSWRQDHLNVQNNVSEIETQLKEHHQTIQISFYSA